MVIRRVVPAFLVALIMSTLLTWMLGKHLSHPAAVVAATVSMERLVAVNKDLKVGDTLQAGSLQLVEWPAKSLPAGAFTRPQDLAGRVLLVPVAAGQPVLDRFVASLGTGSGLMARIPAGMRAMSVQTDEVSNVAGFVTPDSFVDVLVTNGSADRDEVSTSTLLQDVRVLAVGQRFEADSQPQDKAAPKVENEPVTLLLSPQDARRLTYAIARGKIMLVLRNGADRNVVAMQDAETRTQKKLAGSSMETAAAKPSAGRKATPAAAHTDGFSVQTVAGGKQSDESFEGKK